MIIYAQFLFVLRHSFRLASSLILDTFWHLMKYTYYLHNFMGPPTLYYHNKTLNIITRKLISSKKWVTADTCIIYDVNLKVHFGKNIHTH